MHNPKADTYCLHVEIKEGRRGLLSTEAIYKSEIIL
jgi:hypothetical protein